MSEQSLLANTLLESRLNHLNSESGKGFQGVENSNLDTPEEEKQGRNIASARDNLTHSASTSPFRKIMNDDNTKKKVR